MSKQRVPERGRRAPILDGSGELFICFANPEELEKPYFRSF